jgi:hypothetical protein
VSPRRCTADCTLPDMIELSLQTPRRLGAAGSVAFKSNPECVIIIAMNEFVPKGYISIHEALNRVGRPLFRSDWTGEEHKARRGLISEEEWLKNKDVPPPRGSGATGASPPVPARPRSTGDPSDPSYQAEYRARQRYLAVRDRLREMLEAGDLEAAILDPWTGALHRASAALWRQHDAGRLIDRGRALLPSSSNTGSLLVKEFAEASAPTKPISRAQGR